MKLTNGGVVAADGVNMIFYDPATGVAGKQPLGEESSSGLTWLLSGFAYQVTTNEAVGRALDAGRKIVAVRLAWDSNFQLQQFGFRLRNSTNWFDIKIYDLRPLTGISPTLFSYKPPAGSRTVENPLSRRRLKNLP